MDYQAWLVNFATIANANLAALGLVAGDMTLVTTAKTPFDSAIPDVVAKRIDCASSRNSLCSP